ncbi:MAG: hypothetical protein RIR26_1536 [Pseudomonadota bacterium]|jgi:hypothetical protein
MFFADDKKLKRLSPDDAMQDDALWRVADEFRTWVVRDLEAVGEAERVGFRGDYLFLIDGRPSFLVVVSPHSVSCGRLVNSGAQFSVVFDLGKPIALSSEALALLLEPGGVRVCVSTDALTLKRLLAGTLRAKVAYLNGAVKIAGDLPCFMRLVALLKGRGVGPRSRSENGASDVPFPQTSH